MVFCLVLLLVCGVFYLSNIYLDGAFSELCTSFHFKCYSHASSIHCIFIFYQALFEKKPEECNISVLKSSVKCLAIIVFHTSSFVVWNSK
jgi:hypothetical protein